MAEHIKISPADGTWVVRAGGAVLGESANALELTEGQYSPVIYIPRADIAMMFLDKSDTISTCPHKGAATYYSIASNSGLIADAAWSYETPKAGMEAIAGHVAFYDTKVDVEQV